MIVVLCLQQQSITHVPPAPRSRGFSSDSPVSGGRVDRPCRQSPNPPRPGSPDHRYLCEDCVRYVCAYVRMDACMCVDACMDARMYVYACMLACIRACIWNAKHDPRNQNKHTHMPTVTTAPPPAAAPLYHQGCRTVLLPEIAQQDEHSSEPSSNAVQQGCPPRPRSLPLLRHRHRPVEPGPFSQRMTPRCSVCHSYFPDAGPRTSRFGQWHCQQHGERALGEAKHTS